MLNYRLNSFHQKIYVLHRHNTRFEYNENIQLKRQRKIKL